MHEIKEISSLQNPLVKRVLLLKEKSRERKKSGLFVLEGKRELELANKGNYPITTLLFNETLISKDDLLKKSSAMKVQPEIISVSKEVYQKMAHRETTEGVLAVAKSKQHLLSDLKIETENPLILVAEAPEKPGNIGALLRTADAANLDAVLIANPKGDLYNPNVIRSSVGCVFTNQIAQGTSAEIITYIKNNNIKLYAAALSAQKKYTEIDYNEPSAIAVGTESTGLSAKWLENATESIIIPMGGEIDSMNVSVSAAIVIFEALRQRGT
jgi:TrmH family RNA methyltransferase